MPPAPPPPATDDEDRDYHAEDEARIQRRVKAAAEQANVYAVALTFVASVAVFAVLGLLLDKWLGTTPWLLLTGLLLGLVGGSWKFVREARSLGSGS